MPCTSWIRRLYSAVHGVQTLGALRWASYARWRIIERLQIGSRTGTFTLSSPLCPEPLIARHATSDIDVFRHVFVRQEYACIAKRQEVSLIVDCGANVGYSGAYLLECFPAAHLIAVEPDAGNFEILTQNLRPYQGRTRLIRSAVWHETCRVAENAVPYRDGREWSRQYRVAGWDEESIPTIDMKTLLKDSGYARISVLKIDIERAERFLFSANTEWLQAVDLIAIELHDRECEQVFYAALAQQPFTHFTAGELTVCVRASSQRCAPNAVHA